MLRVLQILKKKFTDFNSAYRAKLTESSPHHENRAKILKQELNRGYFDDLRTVHKFEEDRSRIYGAEEAQKFDFSQYNAVTLDNKPVSLLEATERKASLVTIAFRNFSEASINSWVNEYKNEFNDPTVFKVVQISVVDHWFWTKLRYILLSSMKKSVPVDERGNYVCIFGDENALKVQNDLKITNRLQGHVYLIDYEGRIRWKGVGNAFPEGIEDMRKVGLKISRKVLKENEKATHHTSNSTPKEGEDKAGEVKKDESKTEKI